VRIVVDKEGLAKIAGEMDALIAVSNAFRGEQIEHALVVSGLSDAELRLAWEPYRWGRRDIDPMLAVMQPGPIHGVVTRCRQQIVSDQDWYQSRLVSEFFRPIGMNHCIQSEAQLPGGLTHRLAFARPWGARALGIAEQETIRQFHEALINHWRRSRAVELPARTRAVLDGLMGGKSTKEIGDELGLGRSSIDREVQAIYRRYRVHSRAELLAIAREAKAPHEIGSLSPRQRQTLTLLLTGLHERDIACVLGLSFHTAHQYVKAIYRVLGTQSRAELMARFSGLDDKESQRPSLSRG
jgi:DNA-binding NarL/FixJ family response regulator